jgi:peptidoglycan/LPS O-acetylase OafA/YrhL
MAIGGLSAYIIYNRKKEIESSFIFKKPAQIAILTFIFLKLFGAKYLTESSMIFDYLYNTEIISKYLLTCSFAWLIVNTSINQNSFIKLNHKVYDFLGNISYGIYMYHMLVIFGIILFFKNHLANMTDSIATILFYLILTSGVIVISFISKRFFEDYFLKLKIKFRVD